MPTTQTPTLLYDNVFNTIRQYPTAALSASSTANAADVRYVSSGRRERAYWQAGSAIANNYISSDLGAGVTKSVDSLWIDRGHNLWGKSASVIGDDGAGGSIVTQALAIPALNGDGSIPAGGDPTSGTMAVTEEGALYSFFGATAARRRWFFNVVSNMQPLVCGVLLGSRVQLPIFSTTYDEDAGRLAGLQSEESDAGLVATSRVYDYRVAQLTYVNIGSTSYDATIRAMRLMMWARRQCTFVAWNYGLYPARGWLYQHTGADWSAPLKGVLRTLAIPLREVGALIT